MNISLETAKKLKEAGWNAKVSDYWYCQVGGIVVDTDVRGQWELRENANLDIGFGEYVAAPSTDELLEALPYWTHLSRRPTTQRYCAFWAPNNPEAKEHIKYADSPAEALATLWLELKAKGLLPPNEPVG